MVTPGGMIGTLSPPLCGIAWPSYWTANRHDWSIGIVKALLPPLCGVESLYRAKRAWMLQRGDCEKVLLPPLCRIAWAIISGDWYTRRFKSPNIPGVSLIFTRSLILCESRSRSPGAWEHRFREREVGPVPNCIAHRRKEASR